MDDAGLGVGAVEGGDAQPFLVFGFVGVVGLFEYLVEVCWVVELVVLEDDWEEGLVDCVEFVEVVSCAVVFVQEREGSVGFCVTTYGDFGGPV